MITHVIGETSMPRGKSPRDTIGGQPVLPVGVQWPSCECGQSMVPFLQLDTRPEFGLPFESGSHLSVWMCPAHNDAPEIFSGNQLPADFWKRRRMCNSKTRFYELMLYTPNSKELTHPGDRILVPKQLAFTRKDEEVQQEYNEEHATLQTHSKFPGVSLSVREWIRGVDEFKVGGQPSWAQYPEVFQCCCGAEMRFVCQIPIDHPFAKRPEAPEQPNTFSAKAYGLFLGNETYIFACEKQCSPYAVHAVVQN